MKIIGIGGVARAGKDTLFKIIESYLGSKGIPAKRFAFADELKRELDPFLLEMIGISAFTSDPDEKKLIRPTLVEWGRIRRIQSQGTHWTGILQPQIEEAIKDGFFPVVTDVRYDEYKEDELFWVQEKNDGFLIHLRRILTDGNYVLPANEDEHANDSNIYEKANLRLCLKTFENLDELKTDVIENHLKFHF